MTETRFKPVRAGIINLWDYFDEEFVFADGRLALRGHNGSGKTKALEVLFPFVLDGSLDARRLDPFSGENRTMKANLLYRGQDSEHGYVWMEFGRPGETVTLVIGLSVHKNMDRPRPSFYVTGKRMGIEFGLLSADSRPLTAKQLTAHPRPRRVLRRQAGRVSGRRGRPAVRTRPGTVRPASRLADRAAPPAAREGPGPGQGLGDAYRGPEPGR